MKRLSAVAFACLFATAVQAEEAEPVEESNPTALFQGANKALATGKPGEAIAKLEAMGDRGVVDPVVTYDRGLAYAARVHAQSEQPGDLGRAAHGFEEARELTHDAALARDAATALALVHSEVARRRARAGDPVEIEHGFSLGRSIVGLLGENAWSGIAAFMALALSVSIVVRRLDERKRARVAANTAGAIAGSLLLITATLAWAARDERLHLREGIVVAPAARLLDGRHVAMAGVSPIAEGARARIVEESGGFSRIVISGADGYLPSSSLLPIAKPR